MKTSDTHPLQIAVVGTGPGFGRIGVTFCPGKKDAGSFSGPWDRELEIDLEAIADWGAAAVVTLVEAFELEFLQVAELGRAVQRRHMDWVHLPIVDVSVPGDDFEREWVEAGEGIRARLRDGADVVVHCRGGLGRAGTVAARLLVELGGDPEAAIAAVRAVRPGAIETREQEAHVRRARPVPPRRPDREREAAADRAVGALLGLSIGDAIGTTLEFTRRDDRAERLVDMVGGGPFDLRPGQWTDDTAMALALADSLAGGGALDPRDLMARFVDWWQNGRYSCTGACFDIGGTTSTALERFVRHGDPIAGSADPSAAGNGSLMRLAPVAIRHARDPDARRAAAALQSRTTHAAAEAVDACILYADLVAEAIAGAARADVLAPRTFTGTGKITAIAAGGWRGKPRAAIRGSGYVVDALEAALWCVGRTADFRGAVLLAANLREDADTTAAIAGQLAGALYGAAGIPAPWRERVAWGAEIEHKARTLFDRAWPA